MHRRVVLEVWRNHPKSRRKVQSEESMMAEIKKEQCKDLLERHIPPLLKEFDENARNFRTTLPPEHEKARFYEKLLDAVEKLKLQVEECARNG